MKTLRMYCTAAAAALLAACGPVQAQQLSTLLVDTNGVIQGWTELTLNGTMNADAVTGDGGGMTGLGTGLTEDGVGTTYLDDGADTPGSGDYLRVDTVDQAGIEYRTPAEVLSDIAAQPLDADLTLWGAITPSANMQSLAAAADYAAMRALLDLEAGTDFYSVAGANAAFQPLDADLTDLADGSLTGSKVGTGINGSNITSGTVADARIAATIARDSEVTSAVSTHAGDASAHHAPVTLTGTPDYLGLSGQQITLGQIDLTTDVTGVLPDANIAANLMRLDGASEFTGTMTVTNGGSIVITAGGTLAADLGTGSISNWTVNGAFDLGASATVGATAESKLEGALEVADLQGNLPASRVTGLAETFVLTIDDVADGLDYVIGFVPAAFTVTELRFVHSGTGLSSPDVDVTVLHSTDRSAAGNAVVTGGTTVTSSTTGDSVTSSFDDETVAANSWIWIETASTSGTTDTLEVIVRGTYD